MILSAIAAKLKQRAKADFRGRHFEAALIVQAVSWYLRYPLSYRDIEELFGQNERNAHPDTHKRTKLEQGGVTRRRGCCRVVSSSRRGDFASVGRQVISVTGRALPRTG